MADEDTGEDGADNEEGDGKSSGGGSKKLVIIIAAVVLLLIGGAAAAYFMGLFDQSPQAAEAQPSNDSKKAALDLAFFMICLI